MNEKLQMPIAIHAKIWLAAPLVIFAIGVFPLFTATCDASPYRRLSSSDEMIAATGIA